MMVRLVGSQILLSFLTCVTSSQFGLPSSSPMFPVSVARGVAALVCVHPDYRIGSILEFLVFPESVEA